MIITRDNRMFGSLKGHFVLKVSDGDKIDHFHGFIMDETHAIYMEWVSVIKHAEADGYQGRLHYDGQSITMTPKTKWPAIIHTSCWSSRRKDSESK